MPREAWTGAKPVPTPPLEPPPAPPYCRAAFKEHPMLALYIILGFVAVVAAINFIEFGQVD